MPRIARGLLEPGYFHVLNRRGAITARCCFGKLAEHATGKGMVAPLERVNLL